MYPYITRYEWTFTIKEGYTPIFIFKDSQIYVMFD